MNDVYEFLRKYISHNGYAELDSDAFAVYEAMIEEGIAEEKARLVMVTLMGGVYKLAASGKSVEDMVEAIQREHFLLKKSADQLAKLYIRLFNPENLREWESNSGQGFDDFCDGVWEMDWSGLCEWHAKGHMVLTCTADVHLEFEVADKELLDKHLSERLKKNPFLSEDDLYRIMKEEFSDILDRDFYDFCNEDDYYEPYMEEFTSEGTYGFGKLVRNGGLRL